MLLRAFLFANIIISRKTLKSNRTNSQSHGEKSMVRSISYFSIDLGFLGIRSEKFLLFRFLRNLFRFLVFALCITIVFP